MQTIRGASKRGRVLDVRLRTHDYLVILTIFFAIFAYLILDGKNELYQVMNVRTQVIILASLSVVACGWFLLAKGPVPQFLSMAFLVLFSLLVIRLLLSEMGITLLYCLLLFYAISVKLPKASGIPVSLMLGGIILLLEGFRTLFGISFPPPSVSELWASRFLIISILITCHYLSVTKQKIFEYHTELLLKELYINNLIDTNLGFQDFALQIEKESRIEERLSMTREIHDITGYTLMSIIMMLEYAEDLLHLGKSQTLKEILDQARLQARNGHGEIRSALKQLRTIEDVAIPLENRILKIVQNFKKVTHMEIQLEFSNFQGRRYKRYDHFLLRYVQEGLTNAFRHGKATKVTMIFFEDSSSLVVSIEDNGLGSKEIVEGIGLKGMAERIEDLSGTLMYQSLPTGFLLVARLPILNQEFIELEVR